VDAGIWDDARIDRSPRPHPRSLDSASLHSGHDNSDPSFNLSNQSIPTDLLENVARDSQEILRWL